MWLLFDNISSFRELNGEYFFTNWLINFHLSKLNGGLLCELVRELQTGQLLALEK